MGSIHNTRILRFLIVLGAVILTIFIYASYSSSSSLTPPHMRTVSISSQQIVSAAAFHSQQQSQIHHQSQQYQMAANKVNNNNSSALSSSSSMISINLINEGSSANSNANNNSSSQTIHNNNNNNNDYDKKFMNRNIEGNPSVVKKPHQHHREPTIDEDAAGGGAGGIGGPGGVGGGGGGGNVGGIIVGVNSNGYGIDDVPDDAVLDNAVNNDLLEEQYSQNIDNTMGNINNSAGAQSQMSLQQQQQSQQQLLQQNAIVDSDVLIPTSNLQKFIENADKILKNMTVIPPSQSATAGVAAAAPPQPPPLPPQSQSQSVAINKPPETDPAIKKGDEQKKPQKPESNNEDIDADESEALPPSVVMTIKRSSVQTAKMESSTNAKKISEININNSNNNNNNNNMKKVTPSKSNLTRNDAVDPTQGIQTQRIYEYGHINEELNIEKICPNSGADLKLFILITSAQSHAEARLAIRQTWAHYGVRRDVSIAFILGRTTNETINLALTQENFIYGDLIRGNFIDSYNNLTLKTISSLEWVDEHCPRAKYILKTDDDMFINVPKLLSFLENHSKEKRVIYGRLAKKWKPIRNKKSKYYVSTGQFSAAVFPPFTTGPAYVMSSDIIHDLYTRSLQQVYLKLEDVFTTGIVAQQLGIKRVHANEFLNRRIAFNPCNIRKTISVHMIKPNEQFDLWKKLLDQTTKCK